MVLHHPQCRERGFTLIEVIVALAISAAVLGAFFPLISQASLSASRAESRLEALFLADAKLIEAADGEERSARRENGRWPGGLMWTLEVEEQDASPAYRLFKYTLAVTRDGKPVARLETMRLGKTGPPS